MGILEIRAESMRVDKPQSADFSETIYRTRKELLWKKCIKVMRTAWISMRGLMPSSGAKEENASLLIFSPPLPKKNTERRGETGSHLISVEEQENTHAHSDTGNWFQDDILFLFLPQDVSARCAIVSSLSVRRSLRPSAARKKNWSPRRTQRRCRVFLLSPSLSRSL